LIARVELKLVRLGLARAPPARRRQPRAEQAERARGQKLVCGPQHLERRLARRQNLLHRRAGIDEGGDERVVARNHQVAQRLSRHVDEVELVGRQVAERSGDFGCAQGIPRGQQVRWVVCTQA
jgi:hypothetical protein